VSDTGRRRRGLGPWSHDGCLTPVAARRAVPEVERNSRGVACRLFLPRRWSDGARPPLESSRRVLPRHGAERRRGAALPGRLRPDPLSDPPRPGDPPVRAAARDLVSDDHAPPRSRRGPHPAAFPRDAVAPRPLRSRAQRATPPVRGPLRGAVQLARDWGRAAPRSGDRVRPEQPRPRGSRRSLARLAVVGSDARAAENRTLVRSLCHG
jgi:hypothetical protein